MSKTRKVDEAALLAERMLEVLTSQRDFGGDRYPPTLQHLGELCDGASSHDLIVKAAEKKAFKDKAVVTKKVDKKPALDSPVYFKGDVPKPEELLATRMLAVLEAQRRLGAAAYPPTFRRLAELSEIRASDKNVPKAAVHAIFADRAVIVAKAGKKPGLDAPVVLKEGLERGIASVLPALLRFALSPVASKVKGQTVETAAFKPEELKKRFIVNLQDSFEKALESGVAHRDLPQDIAWVVVKGEPLMFLVANLRPGAPQRTDGVETQAISQTPVRETTPSPAAPPARDFSRSFLEAFEQMDRRNGSTNFVKLADLRQALAEFSRDEFDAGLRQLRIDGVFSLDSHEGLHGSLTHEERESGVREAGSLLVYASRR